MATNEKAIVDNLNRRARFYGGENAAQLTFHDVLGILEFFERKSCQSGVLAFSLDHVKPLKLGGENIPENIQVLTDNENKAKGDEEIDYRAGRICTREWLEQWKQSAKGDESSKSTESPTKLQDKSIDWQRIKTRYIVEEITLRDLAQSEGISDSSVLKRAAREHWAEQREQHRIKVTSDVITSLAAKEVDARLVAADTARAVIDSWLASVKEEASANDALNAAKLLLLLNGDPTSRAAVVDETDLDTDDIIGAAQRIAGRAYRQAEDRDTERSAADEDGAGAGWTD